MNNTANAFETDNSGVGLMSRCGVATATVAITSVGVYRPWTLTACCELSQLLFQRL